MAVDGTYQPTRVCDERISEKLAIPVTYLRKLREQALGLWDANVNGSLKRADHGRWFLVRCPPTTGRAALRGVAVARQRARDRLRGTSWQLMSQVPARGLRSDWASLTSATGPVGRAVDLGEISIRAPIRCYGSPGPGGPSRDDRPGPARTSATRRSRSISGGHSEPGRRTRNGERTSAAARKQTLEVRLASIVCADV